MSFDLDSRIRKVPDHPKPGILFYDITSILMDPAALEYCVTELVRPFRDEPVSGIAAIESRGFLFGAPIALRLGVPLMLVRKAGKLPGKTVSASYELEYGTDSVEMHVSDLEGDGPVLIVDDLVATGGTAEATAALIERAGRSVAGIACVVGLPFLPYAERLKKHRVHTLITYESE